MADDWFGGFCKSLFVHTYIHMYVRINPGASRPGALGNFSAFITDYSIKYSYINQMMHKNILKSPWVLLLNDNLVKASSWESIFFFFLPGKLTTTSLFRLSSVFFRKNLDGFVREIVSL